MHEIESTGPIYTCWVPSEHLTSGVASYGPEWHTDPCIVLRTRNHRFRMAAIVEAPNGDEKNPREHGLASDRRDTLVSVRLLEPLWYLQLHQEEAAQVCMNSWNRLCNQSTVSISTLHLDHGFSLFLAVSHGRVFKTSILGRPTVFVTGREASRILLSGKDGSVSLNLSYAGKQVLGPTSLLTTAGEEHKQLRRLIAEPLSVDSLKRHFQFIDDWAIKTLEGWPGRPVLVLEEASTVSQEDRCSSTETFDSPCKFLVLSRWQFTLKVITSIMMSLEPAGDEQDEFRANFKLISSTFSSLPLKIPGTTFHRGIQVMHMIRGRFKQQENQTMMMLVVLEWRRLGTECTRCWTR